DEFCACLFTLVVRDNELMFTDEDVSDFWFTEKSESGVLEFIKEIEKEVGKRHLRYWVSNGKEQVKLYKILEEGN
ncbi:MAG: hypothetical protein R6U96_04605, partial [Promethearchaeia archaeon]